MYIVFYRLKYCNPFSLILILVNIIEVEQSQKDTLYKMRIIVIIII